MAVFDLGIGRTELPAEMRYRSMAAGPDGKPVETVREVRLTNPQRTLNRNMVLLVDINTTIADQSVEHLSFLTAAQYADPQIRAQFCEYERAFIDAIFEGWSTSRVAGRRLDGSFE